MRIKRAATRLIVGFVLLGLLSAGAFALSAVYSAGGPTAQPAPIHVAASVTPSHVTKAAPHPALTFPRTVVVETFTGVWCIHCPTESQALYYLDGVESKNVLVIAELHGCAAPPPNCLENYVPPDNTTTVRGSFYGVTGYPTVFTDGQHEILGASNNEPQMLSWYEQNITRAAAIPGNVSIAQSAEVTSTGVTATVNVTSGLTGSYNAVTYLLEYIGKTNVSNGYGPHDVGWAVRETLRNHPISLTAGNSTSYVALGKLLPNWNTKNLSVITLVQDNATKVVENGNFGSVVTAVAGITPGKGSINTGGTTSITVQVTNTSTGLPAVNRTVTLGSNLGGSFSPSSGLTDSNGMFFANFTAPNVTSLESIVVTANVSYDNELAGSGTTTILVNPLSAPSVARNLVVLPGSGVAVLNWTAPLSGSGGVTYHIYESASASGSFSLLSTTTQLGFTDPQIAPGTVTWFKISASNPAGFSLNTSTVTATSLNVQPVGLPSNLGWWISEAPYNFSTPLAVPQTLFLPAGAFAYAYGSLYSGYLANPTQAESLFVGTTPLNLNLSFAPRMANLIGTINPVGASVSVNGVPLTVTDGTFSYQAEPGVYYVNSSASGYQTNSTQVTLTPGNTSRLSLTLESSSSGSGGSSSPLSGSTLEIIGLVAGVAVVILVVAAIVSMRRRRGMA